MILLLLNACYAPKSLSTRLSQNFFCRQGPVFIEQVRTYSAGTFSKTGMKLEVNAKDFHFWKAYAESLVVEKNMLLQKLGVNTGFLEAMKLSTSQLMNKKNDASESLQNDGIMFPHSELIAKIVRTADPLYPVTSQDVERILDIYTSLANRPIDGITNVLKGRTNTHKSAIYSAVLKHVQRKNLTLENCRQIYAKLTKSLKGDATSVMRQLMLKKKEIPTDNSASVNQETEQALTISKGKYDITAGEQKLLNSLYRETATIDSKYVARVLGSNKKLKPNTSTNKAVLAAIDTIKEKNPEMAEELNLNYFRKLHWLSKKVMGHNGNLQKINKQSMNKESTSDNNIATKKHKKYANITLTKKKKNVKRSG